MNDYGEKRASVIYLAGPISGNDNYKEAFGKAETRWTYKDQVVLNPASLPGGLSEEDYMGITLAMVRAADCVAVLDGWEASLGTVAEVAYALKQGKFVFTNTPPARRVMFDQKGGFACEDL